MKPILFPQMAGMAMYAWQSILMERTVTATKSGMLFLEVSLIAFLLQGNDANGFESLARTFVISGAVVAADVLLKVRCYSKMQA